MDELANGKISRNLIPGTGDWTTIRFDKILKLDWVREEFNPKEPVYFLKETIRKCDCGPTEIFFITILRDNHPDQPVEIPLELLCLSKHQQEELVLHKLVPKKYFKRVSIRFQAYYLKDDGCFPSSTETEDDQ